MSEEFEAWWNDDIASDSNMYELLQRFSKNIDSYSKNLARSSWKTAREGMVPLDEVMKMAKRHTMRPEAFIKELEQKFGGK